MPAKTPSALQLAWPTVWADVFEREGPLLIEIGFGNAQFLLDLAKARPMANVLGVEISLPSLRKGERKLARCGVKNVRLVRATGQVALWALCPVAAVSELHVNFPDPWPKAAHQGRRLITSGFLHLVATRMAAGGRLDIATDHAAYAAWIADCLTRSPYFHSCQSAPSVTESDRRPRTKYEAKAIEQGRICHYFRWRRNSTPAANDFPFPKELPMPHVILHAPMSLGEFSDHFEPLEWVSGTVSIRLIDVFRSKRHEKLLVDTFVGEEPIEQRVLLEISQREPDQFSLHLHEAGHPRPTAGIQTAIGRLAQWMIELHPAAHIVRSNLRSP